MDKTFVRFPVDSVILCAESVGIQPSQEVACGMVEDVSFRIRQLTDTASQFMRHSKRRKLIGDDIDKAMKWSGLEPLYGHSSDQSPSFHSIHASGLYSVPDPEVKLADIACSTSFVNILPLPKPPTIKASWLALEGTVLSNGVPGSSYAGLPHGVIELRRSPQESQQRYLSLLLEAITGENEDLRRVALADIQSNPSFANVLPDVAQYMSEALTMWLSYLPYQVVRLLKLVTVIFKNTYLFLDPYVQLVFPLVKSILFNTSYLHTGGSCSHWQVREAAAVCLAVMDLRCGCTLNVEIREDLLLAFRQALASADVPLHVLCGILLTLCHLGTKSLTSVLLPHLDAVNSRVQALLTPNASQRESALHVCNALLLAAQVLLTLDPGRGGQVPPLTPDEVKSHSLLYGYLEDMFGEKLTLRLCAQASYAPLMAAKESVVGPGLLPGRGAPSDDILLKFLNQEGFKSTRPQPPITQLRQRGPGRLFGGRELFRITVRWNKVPYQGNVLENEGSGGRRGVGVAERGAAQSLNCRAKMIRTVVLGANSCWL